MFSEYDYIVVGSGAGGGPLACNLAKHGYTVALFEAGRDPNTKPNGKPNYNYRIPALHGQATEDVDISWDFFVNHYQDEKLQKSDSKYEGGDNPEPAKKGIWYPRASALGGCTAHNAMITVYPHKEDWEYIRNLTRDDSWSAENMRRYFQKLEDCRYRSPSPNTSGHGFGGWLTTSLADPTIAFQDPLLLEVVLAALSSTLIDKLNSYGAIPLPEKFKRLLENLGIQLTAMSDEHALIPASLRQKVAEALATVQSLTASAEGLRNIPGISGLLEGDTTEIHNKLIRELLKKLPLKELLPAIVRYADPNDVRVTENNLDGIFAIPLATNGVSRISTREVLTRTAAEFPYRLHIFTETFVTKVLIENQKAVGVEYVRQPNAYLASPNAKAAEPLGKKETLRVRANGEVILSGGAFNTPQILMLSGIGPEDELKKHNITPVAQFLPGVGRNLQDRYEVGVIAEMKKEFAALTIGKFVEPADPENPLDPFFEEWVKQQKGIYTTNGAVLSIVRRSKSAETAAPDLFIFGLPGSFRGYFHGYPNDFVAKANLFTWAILKGHTRNTGGRVTLRDDNPRNPPLINFNYFQEGNGEYTKDLDSIVEAVDFVRRMMSSIKETAGFKMLPDLPLDDLTKVREFIKNESWGHHACGTCAIGRTPAEGAVVDSRFRVFGVNSLRVVDASVFPKIPGFFIVTPIYMISEKASQVILEDAQARA